MTIEEHVSLAAFTTFRIGGAARFFCRVSSVAELKEALLFAREKRVGFFVVGEGSNILVGDEGFSGIVIKMEIKGVEFGEERTGAGQQEKGQKMVDVYVGAGEAWDAFVAMTVSRELYGLENLSGIPGTVGAAPVQNIGAYGVEVKDSVSSVEALNTETLQVDKFSAAACAFSYRDSFFKSLAGKKYVIVAVNFLLKKPSEEKEKKGLLHTEYKDIEFYFKQHGIIEPTQALVRNAILAIRAAKLPDIKKLGTAGSFFKNPIITKEHYAALVLRYPSLPFFAVGGVQAESHVKVPLAWILDNVCNFKGMKEGNVGVYQNQALVLVNWGGASADEIKTLAAKMMAKVKKMTDIECEPEVQYVGS